jgi:hypothetical protein
MVIDPQLVVALAEELSTAKERDRKAETLTAREIEVLQLLAFGTPTGTSPSASTSPRHREDPPRAHLREARRVRPHRGGRRGAPPAP